MQQRGLGLEQTRHRQAFTMHFLHKLLNAGPHTHAVRPEERKFDMFWRGILTMRHRGECVRRFLRHITGLFGMGGGAKVQSLSRRLKADSRLPRRSRLQPSRRRRNGGAGQQAQCDDFESRSPYCLCFKLANHADS